MAPAKAGGKAKMQHTGAAKKDAPDAPSAPSDDDEAKPAAKKQKADKPAARKAAGKAPASKKVAGAKRPAADDPAACDEVDADGDATMGDADALKGAVGSGRQAAQGNKSYKGGNEQRASKKDMVEVHEEPTAENETEALAQTNTPVGIKRRCSKACRRGVR